MITPSQFLEIWDVELFGIVNYDKSIVELLNIPNEAKEFLNTGLPKSAAPHMSFKPSNRGGLTKISKQLQKENNDEFSKYIFIGSTGNGDPICIMEESGTVVYLDHEDVYAVFINSSIPQLIESLLAYQQFVEKTNEINGENAFLDNCIPDELIKWIRNKLEEIDVKSLVSESFWSEELNKLKM